jgi:serine/threonine protein kinase/WD40 repeat protein
VPRRAVAEPAATQQRGVAGATADDAAPGVEAELVLAIQTGEPFLSLYRVQRILGEGGMGKVFLVRHADWDIDLALKVPRADLVSRAGVVESFVREAQTWIDMGIHPNVATCHYVRVAEGIPLLFVELVEGGSLADAMRREAFYGGAPGDVVRRVLDLCVQTARGLEHAHRLGFVHQDIKPANVLLGAEGTAKLTDFGLAAAVRPPRTVGAQPASPADNGLVSVTGMTPAYCSPEQMTRSKVGPATDVWSWGVMLLEMLIGEVTWSNGAFAAEAFREWMREPAASKVLAFAPAALLQLLARTLSLEPSARPASASLATELVSLYERAYGSYPRLAPPANVANAASRNNRALSLLDLGASHEQVANELEQALASDPACLEAVYNRSLLHWRWGEMTDEEALTSVAVASESAVGDQVLLDMLRTETVVRDGEGAHVARSSAEMVGFRGSAGFAADRSLARMVMAWSTETVAWCDSADAPVWRRYREANGAVAALTLLGDGLIVIGTDSGVVTALSRDGRIRWAVAAVGDAISLLAECERHGGPLVCGRNGEIACLDPMSGRTLCESRIPEGPIGRVSVTSGTLALASGDSVFVVDPHAPSHVRFRAALGPSTAIALSPDRSRLAVGTPSGELLVVPFSGEPRRCVGHAAPVVSLAWSERGHRLASASADGTVRIWAPDEARCLGTFRLQHDYADTVLLSPDGNTVAWVTAGERLLERHALREYEGRARLVLARPRGSSQLAEARREASKRWALAERALVASDVPATIEALERAREVPGFERAPELLRLNERASRVAIRGKLRGSFPYATLPHDAAVTACDTSRDGSLLLSGDGAGVLRLFDPTRLEARPTTIRAHAGSPVTAVAVDARGRFAISTAADGVVAAWELPTLRELWRRLAPMVRKASAVDVSLSLDGERAIVACDEGTVGALRASTGEFLGSWSAFREGCLSVSSGHDGASFVVSGKEYRSGAKLFVGGQLTPLRTNPVAAFARRAPIRWDSIGQIAIVAAGSQVSVLGTRLNIPFPSLVGHTKVVHALALSPHFIASASADGTVRLWSHGEASEPLETLRAPGGELLSVATPLSGHWVAAGADSGDLLLWRLEWELQTGPAKADTQRWLRREHGAVRSWTAVPGLLERDLAEAGLGALVEAQVESSLTDDDAAPPRRPWWRFWR